MPDGVLRLLIGGALLLHGLGHGGAMGALWWIAEQPGTETGGWTAARSWAFPTLAAAPMLAIGFWTVALVGFVIAALSFWGVLLPGDWWRPVAVLAAVVSLVGILLFAGNWPTFNTIAAVAMNVAVLVAVLILHWPPETVAG